MERLVRYCLTRPHPKGGPWAFGIILVGVAVVAAVALIRGSMTDALVVCLAAAGLLAVLVVVLLLLGLMYGIKPTTREMPRR